MQISANLAQSRVSSHKAAVETAKAGKARAKRRTFEGGTTAAAVGGVVGIVGGPVSVLSLHVHVYRCGYVYAYVYVYVHVCV